MKHSEVIRAGIERLWDGNGMGESGHITEVARLSYSCHAVMVCDPTANLYGVVAKDRGETTAWMQQRFGDVWESGAFTRMPQGKKRQLARALWLTLAAHIAEEEGQ